MLVANIIIVLLISLFCFEFIKINHQPSKAQYQLSMVAFAMGAIIKFFINDLDQDLKDLFYTTNSEQLINTITCYLCITILHVGSIVIVFLLFQKIFPKAIEKPMDYLVYISSCALGCCAVENVYWLYMIDSAIVYYLTLYSFVIYVLSLSPIVYWFIMNRYRKNNSQAYHPLIYFAIPLVSITAFRLISFYFINENEHLLNFLFASIFFFIHISFLANTIKNAHNISPSFTYKRYSDKSKSSKRLILFLAIIAAIQVTLISLSYNFGEAVFYFITGVIYIGQMIFFSVIILSRIKFIKNQWSPLRIELPYRLPPMGLGIFDDDTDDNFDTKTAPKLETNNELYIGEYFNEYFKLHLYPYTDEKSLAYIEDKFFFDDTRCFFLTRIYESDKNSSFRYVILMPKAGNANYAFDKYLLIAIMNVENKDQIENLKTNYESFSFENWGIIIDLDDEFSVYPD